MYGKHQMENSNPKKLPHIVAVVCLKLGENLNMVQVKEQHLVVRIHHERTNSHGVFHLDVVLPQVVSSCRMSSRNLLFWWPSLTKNGLSPQVILTCCQRAISGTCGTSTGHLQKSWEQTLQFLWPTCILHCKFTSKISSANWGEIRCLWVWTLFSFAV